MDDTDIDIHGILGVLRRQAALIIAATALALLAAAASLFLLTPIYSATALLLYDPAGTALLDPEAPAPISSASENARIDSAVELMRSDALLLRVIAAEDLTSDPEFAPRGFFPGQGNDVGADAALLNGTLARLRNAVSVQRRGTTYLIAVEARSQSPARAAELANALAQAHIEAERAAKVESILGARDLLAAQMLEQRDTLARGQYQAMLARAQQLESQASLQIADSRLVSPARPASSPSFPSGGAVLALSALLGLGGGVALAFIRENLIGGFMSAEQLQSVLQIGTAAAIPRQGKAEQQSLADLMVTQPLTAFPESVRRLRASTDLALRRRPQREGGAVVAVTSALPGEGKTITALALARSYALAGHCTLLIDCDLRDPGVHQQLAVAPPHGLFDLMNQPDADLDVRGVVARDRLTTLTAIVGAHRSTIPTDQILAGSRFVRLLQAARRAYDVIILDTPPIGEVVDAFYIAPQADVVLFVSRWASTPQREARAAIASLREALGNDGIVLGVLSQQDDARTAYRRHHGGYLAAAAQP
ncbi:MAG: hypothetical protein ABS76_22410 [Pelagibacterium sp. SCN 64-44]|nr:MAG: hypothetical protein ABS76_22410 [Pelagibacterium sp. SCN 64-44]